MRNAYLRAGWLLLLFLCTTPAFAQDFWKKKPYTEWSEKECRRLLEDSPWAKTYTVSRAVLQELGTRTDDRGRESAPKVEYRVQLRSALPIRQAMVRLEQIGLKYDKLSAEDQHAFDERAKQFLSAEFPDRIVMYILYSANTPTHRIDLHNFWHSSNSAIIQNDMQLFGGRGLSAYPIRFSHSTSEGDAFQVVFPREQDEKPLIEPQDKELKLRFLHPKLLDLPSDRVFVTFKVQDMVFNGKLTF